MSFEAITTQEELDRIISARLNREAVKANEAMDALKLEHTKAIDALKSAHATELDAARTASAADVAAAKAEADAANLTALRLTTANEHGVPANLISGTTADELKASAAALLEFQKTGTAHGPAQGLDTLNSGDNRDAEARAIFGL